MKRRRQRNRPVPPNRLRQLRKQNGVGVIDLAQRFHRDVSAIYRWESGAAQVPDEVKLTLADLYGVSAAYLMGWEDKAA